MKKLVSYLFSAFALAALTTAAFASGGGAGLMSANIQPDKQVSLQNGAKLYVNYCLGCHSLDHQRYERMGKDLGLSKDVVMENLMFTGEKIGEQMKIAMRKDDAAKWFGAAPPDLTLVARSRSPDWIYTYLKSFYQDENRPYGVNNAAFPNVGMPHVLQSLQGMQIKTEHGFELVSEGTMTAEEYDTAARDITNFLSYVGEPVQQYRKSVGIWVVLFLLVFFALGYYLKQEYWKDVYPHGH